MNTEFAIISFLFWSSSSPFIFSSFFFFLTLILFVSPFVFFKLTSFVLFLFLSPFILSSLLLSSSFFFFFFFLLLSLPPDSFSSRYTSYFLQLFPKFSYFSRFFLMFNILDVFFSFPSSFLTKVRYTYRKGFLTNIILTSFRKRTAVILIWLVVKGTWNACTTFIKWKQGWVYSELEQIKQTQICLTLYLYKLMG